MDAGVAEGTAYAAIRANIDRGDVILDVNSKRYTIAPGGRRKTPDASTEDRAA